MWETDIRSVILGAFALALTGVSASAATIVSYTNLGGGVETLPG